MNIRLKNIGIIKDSAIEIKGLTVITGQNNSGKTTVSKALFSLIDSVSNLKQKSVIDRFFFAVDQIEKACETFPFHYTLKRRRKYIENECLDIFFSEDYEDRISPDKIDLYLTDLIAELNQFNILEPPYHQILDRYFHPLHLNLDNVYEKFDNYKEEAIEIIKNALASISSDPDLIHYVRQSINATLLLEFYGQIQPVALNNVSSSIEIYDNGNACFQVPIVDNEIPSANEIVYWSSPYEKAYFIDNPFILDEPAFRKSKKYITAKTSYIDESRIIAHDNKLKYLLNYGRGASIFEESMIDQRYKTIKEKIDAILPGKFIFNNGEQFYIHNDIKLNCGNLATGSKMFSIIKRLLERGAIDENTLLILDEPESHLHPKWQNLFVEIMILLVKEIGCHVLLTTHSSHFMLAVDAYMRKYEITDRCNFYQTEQIDNGPFVSYKCVNDSLNLIYQDFVTYLSDMKLLRNEFFTNDIGD